MESQLLLFPEPAPPPEPWYICSRLVLRWMPKVERELEVQEYVRSVHGGLFLYTAVRTSALATNMAEWHCYLKLPSKHWTLEEVPAWWNTRYGGDSLKLRKLNPDPE